MLVGHDLVARAQQFEIPRVDFISHLASLHLVHGLADHLFAGPAEKLFGLLVDEEVAHLRQALDDDRGGHVVDDRVEKGARLVELALRAHALADVFVGRHPAATVDRLVDDRDGTSVSELDRDDVNLALLDRLAQFGIVFLRIERKRASRDAGLEQVADRAAGPDLLRIDAVHLAVALVPNLKAILCIEHAEALVHVVESAGQAFGVGDETVRGIVARNFQRTQRGVYRIQQNEPLPYSPTHRCAFSPLG